MSKAIVYRKKPSWGNVQGWANYLAMDSNGIWYWYECEPRWDNDKQAWIADKGRVAAANDYLIPRKTLEVRPR